MPSLLNIESLKVCIAGRSVVNGIHLQIKKGQTLALVGESGSGKSVTAHSILQLLDPRHTEYTGSIFFNGEDLLQADIERLREHRGCSVAMIFQEPMTALNPLKTIDQQIIECLPDRQKLSQNAAKQRVIELLQQVRIPQAETRWQSLPHQLSGGQRQRVMIAMAIANHPQLLIADEPTTALDVTVARDILDLLKSLQQQYGMALLLISHDLRMVEKQADYVAVMQAGNIVEYADCKTLFSQPSHSYTQQLLAMPTQKKNSVISDESLLAADNISVHYPLAKNRFWQKAAYFTALEQASFSLKRGETLGIVGESGSGKSSLANALLKLVPLSDGKLHFMQQEVGHLSNRQFRTMRQHLQVVFQDPFASLSPRMTVEDIIGEGLKSLKKLPAEQWRQAVSDVMQEVGLNPDWRWRYPHEFSGGQRQRIAIARALIMRPQCIILDEPTSALDRNVQFQVLDLLLNLQQRYGLSYLFISHDLRLVQAFCHRVLVIHEGKIVEQGDSEQIFNTPQHVYTQKLLAAAFDRE